MKTYDCSPEAYLANAKLNMRVVADEAACYREIADRMAEAILNRHGERLVMICPVGPIAQYPLFVERINRERISLKNVWFINMDEYLTENDRWIPIESCLSFRGFMERMVYGKIAPDLIMPPEQRLFPEPGKEAELDQLIERLGGADCCYTGVGINGHIAFNEPPEEAMSDEAFCALPTRCLNIAGATVVTNGANKIGGALDLMPRRCVTLGMRPLLACRELKVYMYLGWQWGIARKIALEPCTQRAPASFLQKHPGSEMIITQQLLEWKLPGTIY